MTEIGEDNIYIKLCYKTKSNNFDKNIIFTKNKTSLILGEINSGKTTFFIELKNEFLRQENIKKSLISGNLKIFPFEKFYLKEHKNITDIMYFDFNSIDYFQIKNIFANLNSISTLYVFDHFSNILSIEQLKELSIVIEKLNYNGFTIIIIDNDIFWQKYIDKNLQYYFKDGNFKFFENNYSNKIKITEFEKHIKNSTTFKNTDSSFNITKKNFRLNVSLFNFLSLDEDFCLEFSKTKNALIDGLTKNYLIKNSSNNLDHIKLKDFSLKEVLTEKTIDELLEKFINYKNVSFKLRILKILFENKNIIGSRLISSFSQNTRAIIYIIRELINAPRTIKNINIDMDIISLSIDDQIKFYKILEEFKIINSINISLILNRPDQLSIMN